MPIDDHTGAPFGSAELAAAYAGPDYGAVLWEPTAESAAASRLAHYARWLADRRGLHLDPGQELWEWSVTDLAGFWGSLWDYFGVLGERGDGPVLTGGPMPDVALVPRRHAQLRRATRCGPPAPTRAGPRSSTAARTAAAATLTYGELDREVARVRGRAGRHSACAPATGSRRTCPTSPQALIGLLATASLGAIWSSCSPDFGAAQRDRPVRADHPEGAGRRRPATGTAARQFDRRAEVARPSPPPLPGLARWSWPASRGRCRSPRRLDLAGRGGAGLGRPGRADPPAADHEFDAGAVRASAVGAVLLGHHRPAQADRARPRRDRARAPQGAVPASGPRPRGRVLLVHHHRLDDVELPGRRAARGRGDRAATTAAPAYPGTDALWRLAAETGVTYFGTGAPYLLACAKAGLAPGRELDLSRLRGIGSTGSPLPPEGFGWVYEQCRAPDLQSRLVLRRHRRVHRVRRALPAAAGPGGHHRRAAASAPRSRRSTRRATRSSARSASWSSPRRCRPCRSASGTTRTASGTGPATSPTTRACGGTATGS